MSRSLGEAWRVINMLRARVNTSPNGTIRVGGGLFIPNVHQIVVISTGDADNYVKWINTDIVTYPATFAFVNLQHTAPDGPNGVFNLGIRHVLDAGPGVGDQSGFSAWLNGAGVIIEHNGAWRYVLDMSYDYININAPVNILPLTDGVPEPAAIPGSALIYVDNATGDLMCKFGDGVVKTLATDS